MAFWDTSSVVPLLVAEPTTVSLRALLHADSQMIVWWATRVECISALTRRIREGSINSASEERARSALGVFEANWTEVEPTPNLRLIAERLLMAHPLRAADALQLAAALVWSDGNPTGRVFVSLDNRLREAARREGLSVEPAAREGPDA